LTVHGRPVEQVVPFLTPNARLLLLTQDGATPAVVAALLRERGFGSSRMTVLAALGGPNEASRTGTASDWTGPDPDFHVLAVECLADDNTHGLPLTGLPDDAFEHDGQMTKREIRALTLAALAPRRGHLLWDIGSGCGSVAIEWLRAARDTEAVGVEPRAERRALAAANATRLGAPRLQQIEGTAPEALAGLPEPDAIFIGGGLSEESAAAALAALPRHGRLVANAVTLESEALLAGLQERHGGHLVRLSVQRAETVGRRRGWRAAMPVTQWSLTK
ncbi:MAG: precorrin-6Y C5,15-methyltransferase (decarboxylating) subunit CbiT, partial [Pseudomonadota bacterium]